MNRITSKLSLITAILLSGFAVSSLEPSTAVVVPQAEFTEQLGNRFLLDPNEMTGIGLLGPYDNTHSQDLGNVGSVSLTRTTGGFEYPFDVRLKRFRIWHSNSNADAEAWGWFIARAQKVDDSTAVLATTYILDEVADSGGAGPRDYGNTRTFMTDIEIPDTPEAVIPAGETITMGVSAPTANNTNYYVNCHGGYFLFERLDIPGGPPIIK